MIVIFEGLDGCGKSTLAKRFSEKYAFKYIHEGYTDDVIIKQNRIVEMLQRLLSEKNYIYDRTTLIDDFVYSFLNKKESTLSNYKPIILDILAECKVFYLELDEQVRMKRLDDRGDEYINNTQIEMIKNQYDKFLQQCFNVQHIELTQDIEKDCENVMRRVLK